MVDSSLRFDNDRDVMDLKKEFDHSCNLKVIHIGNEKFNNTYVKNIGIILSFELILIEHKTINISKDFEMAQNVTRISASGNQINILEDNGFDNFINVNDANLSGNRIEKISEKTFAGLKNLKKLDLSQNHISFLDDSTFDALSALKSLDLSYNHIETLSVKLFTSNKNLTELKLDFNRIIKLDISKLPDKIQKKENSINYLKDTINICQNQVEVINRTLTERLNNLTIDAYENNKILSQCKKNVTDLQKNLENSSCEPTAVQTSFSEIHLAFILLGLIILILCILNVCMYRKNHSIKKELELYAGLAPLSTENCKEANKVKNQLPETEMIPIYAVSQKRKNTSKDIQATMPEYATVNKPKKTEDLYATVVKTKRPSIAEPISDIYATVNKPTNQITMDSRNVNKPELIYAELDLKASTNVPKIDKTIYDTVTFNK